MATAAASNDRRALLYDRLLRRNRVVGVLRKAVPVAGAIILLVLLVEIVIDNLGDQFGFADIRIDRDNLVVDTPQLAATGEDGTLYSATATNAKVSITKTDVVELSDAVFDMTPPGDQVRYQAAAAAAELRLKNQQVLVEDVMHISGSDGMTGTLEAVLADMLNHIMMGNGPVHVTFPDGSELRAQSMSYDGNTRSFAFQRAVVTLPDTPGKDR